MTYVERALTFECEGEQLVGILNTPEQPPAVGILVIVGGPQYRVGSHRQFVLLARRLAGEGYAVLRFDYRGMGDATGPSASFEDVTPDIAAAVTTLRAAYPQSLQVVLIGLCDAASAALGYWQATRDARIGGMVILNPWVRSQATLARTHVRHYYGQRLFEKKFWTKLSRGKIDVALALKSFVRNVVNANARRSIASPGEPLTFRDRMTQALRAFAGPILILLSERDYTAKEFLEYIEADAQAKSALARSNIERYDVVNADHTFSSSVCRLDAEARTVAWLLRSFPLASPSVGSDAPAVGAR